MRQTKESNKRAPGRVVIYISVHLASILVLTLNLIVHKPSYCKCSLAWCQARTFLLFTIWTHPSKWGNTRSNMQVLTKMKKTHYKFVIRFKWITYVFLPDEFFHIFFKNKCNSLNVQMAAFLFFFYYFFLLRKFDVMCTVADLEGAYPACAPSFFAEIVRLTLCGHPRKKGCT